MADDLSEHFGLWKFVQPKRLSKMATFPLLREALAASQEFGQGVYWITDHEGADCAEVTILPPEPPEESLAARLSRYAAMAG